MGRAPVGTGSGMDMGNGSVAGAQSRMRLPSASSMQHAATAFPVAAGGMPEMMPVGYPALGAPIVAQGSPALVSAERSELGSLPDCSRREMSHQQQYGDASEEDITLMTGQVPHQDLSGVPVMPLG